MISRLGSIDRDVGYNKFESIILAADLQSVGVKDLIRIRNRLSTLKIPFLLVKALHSIFVRPNSVIDSLELLILLYHA
jgi:hypothetical protein